MDDEKMMGKVEKYLALYKEIKSKTGDDRIAETILTEVAKDTRMDIMKEEREQRNGNGQPATEKQLAYLRNLGITITPEIRSDKLRASQAIDRAIEEQKEKEAYPEVVRIP